MKHRIHTFLLCFLITFLLFPMTAKADMGPKPGVYISFENMGDEVCYGTLLSQRPSTGPASVWDPSESDGVPEHIDTYGLDYDIWKAFVDYQDADGYYFLQEAWQCNESKCFSWTYYPPDTFKILLYYPETDTFVVSGVYERYAFDSYFSVDMKDLEAGSAAAQDVILTARQNYPYAPELAALLCRIVLTILLEIGIALLFGFREKKLLLFITGVNVVTQVVLNVMLNIVRYKSGDLALIFYYFPYEAVVFIIEAVLYGSLFNKISQNRIPGWKIFLYAVTANVLSFIAGFLTALWLPWIF